MPFIDFAALKAAIPIEDAARSLRLQLKPEGNAFRCVCPVAETDNPRGMLITPGKGFICFSCGENGGVINLVMHVKGFDTPGKAAKFLLEQFGTEESTVQNSTVRKNRAKPLEEPTVPQEQKPEGRKQPAHARTFDPDDYAAKLVYSDEVSALGISEEDARELGLGWSNSGMHKGIAFALRWPSGEIAAFASVIGGEVKLPKSLIPPKVVPLKRPA